MSDTTQTICLNMIVKNESHVITRCLGSLKDLIDYWVIVDTGSTDGTQKIIKDFLKDIPGELIERPWVNFGHNRSEALEYARGKGDYIFTIDADEILWRAEGFTKPVLTADSYLVEFISGSITYYKCQFARNALNWYYEGVLHEYIACPDAKIQEIMPGLKIIRYLDGARSSDPLKFQRDALVLEQALLDEPDNDRHVFYLAQSYRDANNWNRAIDNYQRRVEMGGWDEEVWYSLYQIAEIKARREDPWAEVMEAYLTAYQYRPSRAEPLYKILQHYLYKENHLAYLFGKQVVSIPTPHDLLFVEQAVYDYMAKLDFSVCAYWVGDHTSAIRTCNSLLHNPKLPPGLYNRILENRKFSLDAMYPKQQLETPIKNKIKVCVTFYNPGHFLDNCIESLLGQDYDNFEIVFFDDASTDGSAEKVPIEDPRVTLVKNSENHYVARNIHTFVTEYCEPDDIYVHVDGDDWLESPNVLSFINQCYNEYDCWVMYGQFRYNDGRYGGCMPYANLEDFSKLRQNWYASHIRTFRAGLYYKIQEQDPDYNCLKDAEGNWYKVTADVALMCPILELAGFDRVRFNDQVLYVYNDHNPLNDHKVNATEQTQNHHEIMQKKSFTPVTTYIPNSSPILNLEKVV